jgi:hypothetical protein
MSETETSPANHDSISRAILRLPRLLPKIRANSCLQISSRLRRSKPATCKLQLGVYFLKYFATASPRE